MRVTKEWTAALLAVVLCGCAPAAPGELVRSDKQRVTDVGAVGADLAAVSRGTTELGAALYRQAARPGENVFLSPLSVTQAFGMLHAGARGETAAQMAEALRFTLPQERLHPALNALDLTLTEHAKREQDGKRPELRAVNAAWAPRGYPFEPAFLDVLAESYGTGMRVVDFAGSPEGVRQAINGWVEDQTNDRIRELLPEGAIRGDTRLVLTNALYFKARWVTDFDPRGTRGQAFTLLDGSQKQVQMMHTDQTLPRGQGNGYRAVAVPYAGGAFRMLVVLPDAGRFAEVEGRLSADFLQEVRAGLEPSRVALGLPRFELTSTLQLKEALQALGMRDAFEDAADFSGITSEERLRVTGAFHKAFVMVTETGTEAAAATGAVAGPVSMPEQLEVDRPFLFLIEDVETGATLFVGRVVSP